MKRPFLRSSVAGAVLLFSLLASTRAVSATRSAELRERLEGVTEAVIDGRVSALPVAARRVEFWWKANRRAFGAGGDADSTMAAVGRAARSGAANEAAQLAVQLSFRSFAWDGGAISTADQLMLIDLVGMAGWLRARGRVLELPQDVPAAVDSLASALGKRHRPRAAAHLRRSVASVLAGTGTQSARTAAANELLEWVDQLEKILH